MTSDYNNGFAAGVTAAMTLMRAGATADEIATVLDEDPARKNQAGYQDHLRELRRILRTDLLTEAIS